MFDYSSYGIWMGTKSYVIQINACEFALIYDGHIFESEYASDGGVGGWHNISNCNFDTSSAATSGTANIYLERARTVISGCTLKGDGTTAHKQHYIYLTANADGTVINGNSFRTCGEDGATLMSAIYINTTSYNVITGNFNDAESGYFIDGAANYTLYNSNLFCYVSAPGDRISLTGTGNSGDHNMEVT
jgi:hypothetical protein